MRVTKGSVGAKLVKLPVLGLKSAFLSLKAIVNRLEDVRGKSRNGFILRIH
jgi:hypothetical protein